MSNRSPSPTRRVASFRPRLKPLTRASRRVSCDTGYVGTINASEKLTSCPVALAMQATLAPSMHHRRPKAVLQFDNELNSMPELSRRTDVLSGCSCDAGYVGTINASENAQGCITVCQRAELNAWIMQKELTLCPVCDTGMSFDSSSGRVCTEASRKFKKQRFIISLSVYVSFIHEHDYTSVMHSRMMPLIGFVFVYPVFYVGHRLH